MTINHQIYVYERLKTIEDIVGSQTLWPYFIRRLFWSQHVKHWDKIMLATVFYVNGLNPEIFMEWADLMYMCRDGGANNHFRALFHIRALFHLFGARRNYTMYAYNVSQNC